MNKNTSHENLTSIFKEETRKIGESFPEKLKRLLIINTKHPIYVSEDIADQFKKNTDFISRALDRFFGLNKMNNLIKQASAHLKFTNAAAVKVMASYEGSDDEEEMTLIAIDEDVKTSGETDNYTQEMNVFDNYNHEMGHLLVKNGTPSKEDYEDPYMRHLAECSAEAFKAIRHYQVFGNDTGYVESNNFSGFLISGQSPMHFTDIVNHKIREVSLNQDLSKLSMKATVELAGNIAEKYSLTALELKNIAKVFNPAIKCYKKTSNYTTMARECFKVMMKHKDDHNIYRIGKIFLETPRVKKYHLPTHTDFWKDAIKEMKEFEQKSGIDLSILKNKSEGRAQSAKPESPKS